MVTTGQAGKFLDKAKQMFRIKRKYYEGTCTIQRFRRAIIDHSGLFIVVDDDDSPADELTMDVSVWNLHSPPGDNYAGDTVRPVEKAWFTGFQESTRFKKDDAEAVLEDVRSARKRAIDRLPEAERGRAIQALNGDLRRTAQVMVQASQVAAGEGLDDTGHAIVSQAAGYHNYVADDDFAMHGLESARSAKQTMEMMGRSGEEVSGVYQAIKEHIPAELNDELCRYVARLVFERNDYKPPVKELLLEALDKTEAQYNTLVEFIDRTLDRRPEMNAGQLAYLLYDRFGQTILTFPQPSSRMSAILQDAVNLGQAHVKSVFSRGLPGVAPVGTSDGNDYDFSVVHVPFVKQLKLAIGPLDVFVNDPNAADAIEARKAMEYIQEHSPALYRRWLAGKNLARKYLEEGVIDPAEYALFKAEWHDRRGLPDGHYRWKAAEPPPRPDWPVDLLAALDAGLGQLSSDRSKVVNALHDADVLAVLDPQNLHGYFDLWSPPTSIIEGMNLLYRNEAGKALKRLRTNTGRELAKRNLTVIQDFRRRYSETVRKKGQGEEPPVAVAHRMLDKFLESAGLPSDMALQ